MYRNNEKNTEQILQGKKKNQIDDDLPISKKAQRNQWKKIKRQQDQQTEIQNFKTNHTQNKINLKKTPVSKQQRQDLMVQDLKIIVEGCDQQVIRRCIHKANYDKQTALDEIFSLLQQQSQDMSNMFQRKQTKNPQRSKPQIFKTQVKIDKDLKKGKQLKKQNNDNHAEQQAYKIFNQMYDKSQIEISGFQFEELFNEITQIIKEDQKEKGKGLLQINNLVEICMTAKQTILVGLKDLFHVDAQIDINEDDPIHAQLQQFIFDLTKKEAQQQVVKAQQFPSLGQAKKNKKSNQKYSPPKRSIVNELQNQSKNFNKPITKSDFFVPSNRPTVFTQKNAKGIFNVDNQQQSQDALRGLNKEYNHISIQTLKIAYLLLEKNYNLCRTFLDQYYGKEKVNVKISIESSPTRRQKQQTAKRHFISTFRKQSVHQIDEQLQKWSFHELRGEIEHLYALRQVFKMTCNKITNSNQRKQLMRIADQKAPPHIISKLSKASRVKLIEETMRYNPHYVDLHGHREEQVSTILEGLIAAFREQFNYGDQKIKYRVVSGKTEGILQVMTGKGRHSQSNKSILKPCIKNWCQHHSIRALVNEDSVDIYIPLF